MVVVVTAADMTEKDTNLVIAHSHDEVKEYNAWVMNSFIVQLNYLEVMNNQ